MRILNWVQAKINGRQEKKRFEVASSAQHHAVTDTRKEEFSDWPHGLLAIGTFGNNELKGDSQRHDHSENSHFQDLPDFTLEEVSKLQKELTKLLSLKTKSGAYKSETRAGGNANLPLDRFLNCPSSLEVDRMTCKKFCDELDNGEAGDLSPMTKIILNRAKDLLADNRNAIRQKSVAFLLKKMFVCRSGFSPTPNLRDPISESRVEKFLKAMLHKKIYPQNTAPTMIKKYLEKRPMDKIEIRDKMMMMMSEEMEEKEEDGGKWVKTDSEYIVLEM